MKKYYLNFILFIMLLCNSCENDPIFYILENERIIEDRNLDNSLSIQALCCTDSSLFAAAGQLYSRSLTGEKWSSVSHPSGISNCYSLAAISPATVYIAGNDTDGNHSVYHSADNGNNWSLVSLSGDNFVLFSSNNMIYAAANQNPWQLFELSGTGSTIINGIGFSDDKPCSLFYNGSDTLFAQGESLRTFSSGTSETFSGKIIRDYGQFGSIYYALLNDRTIRSSSNWTISNETDYYLSRFLSWDNQIWIGTQNHGLFVYRDSRLEEPSGTNYDITGLNDKTITVLYEDTENTIYAGTLDDGLWSLDENSEYWRRE